MRHVESLSRDGAGLRRFLRVPHTIYRGDPLWVAPLGGEVRTVLSRENPFFEPRRGPAVRRLPCGPRRWPHRRDNRPPSQRASRHHSGSSMDEDCGLLIEGFDSSPFFMTTHNPPYYVDLFEAQGLRKARDLWAYHLEPTQGHVARLAPLADRVLRRMPGLVVRPIRKRDFNGEVARMKEIYNAS